VLHVFLLSERAAFRDKCNHIIKLFDDLINAVIVVLLDTAGAINSIHLLLLHEGLKVVGLGIDLRDAESANGSHLKEGLVDVEESAKEGRASIDERLR
jgi:hypothetical protein